MEGQEIAFLLMMGFSCLVGIFIGYLMFSPRRSAKVAQEKFDDQPFDDAAELSELSSQLDPDTVPAPEPWLADKATLREQARERAMARMAEHAKQVRLEAQAANRGTRQAEPAEQTQPFFDPDTIKEWDQVSPKSARRKPGTWVKATAE